MVWMGDLAQDGEDRIKAMRHFAMDIIAMGRAAEDGDTRASNILQQLKRGQHIKVIQFTTEDIVRSEAVKVLTQLQAYLTAQNSHSAATKPAEQVLAQLQETVQQETGQEGEESLTAVINETETSHKVAGYPVALTVPLFVLKAGTEESARRCMRDLITNVQRYKQHLFLVVVCAEMSRILREEEWPAGVPPNVQLTAVSELDKLMEEYSVPVDQLEYSLEQGVYPHAIEIPALLRHIVADHPECRSRMHAEGTQWLLSADVNDIWTDAAIQRVTRMTDRAPNDRNAVSTTTATGAGVPGPRNGGAHFSRDDRSAQGLMQFATPSSFTVSSCLAPS